MTSNDEQIRDFIAQVTTREHQAGRRLDHPNETLLALEAEWRLKGEERGALLDHLAGCCECARIVLDTRAALAAHSARLVLARVLVGLAACFLVALVVHGFGLIDSQPTSPTSLGLQARAEDLRRRYPDDLADLRVHDLDELTAMHLDVLRSAERITALGPRGLVLTSRPTLRIGDPPTMRSATIKILDATGGVRVEVDLIGGGSALPVVLTFPEASESLTPGESYLLVARFSGPGRVTESTTSFRVATAEETENFSRAAGFIRATGGDEAEVLVADLALRRDLREVCLQVTTKLAMGREASPHARALRAAAARLLDLQE